jgi:hypothetical protein
MTGGLGTRRADAAALLPWDESLEAAAVLSRALAESGRPKAAIARESGMSWLRLHTVLSGDARLRRDEALVLARLLGGAEAEGEQGG